jgi:hypothetical protein
VAIDYYGEATGHSYVKTTTGNAPYTINSIHSGVNESEWRLLEVANCRNRGPLLPLTGYLNLTAYRQSIFNELKKLKCKNVNLKTELATFGDSKLKTDPLALFILCS